MPHPNETLIRRFYEARARDDRATIRDILHPDVAWHDPYPPPHGGELRGAEAVLHDVVDRAGEITDGSTRLDLVDVLANAQRALAIVDWSATIRGRSARGREIAHFEIRSGRIVEAWFYPWDRAASDAFFAAATGAGPGEPGLPDEGAGPPEDWAYVVPIEDHIDLHAFPPRDVPDVVRDYLEAAAQRGFAEVRLIHGKGIGVQRERVRTVLQEHPAVESFSDAPAGRGHWGATIVRLRAAR
jgi:ketosteroid isomerase-like protein